MALIFVLGIGCGPQRATADAVAAHFKPFSLTLSDGTVIHADRAWVPEEPGEDGVWWAVLFPDGLSRSGARNPLEATQFSEAAHYMYNLLRSAPSLYRFAMAGVEAYDCFTVDDLPWLIDNREMNGLVLAVDIWKSFNRPAGFESFAPGYVWRPYQGEPWPPR